jgi:hypothetical protein
VWEAAEGPACLGGEADPVREVRDAHAGSGRVRLGGRAVVHSLGVPRTGESATKEAVCRASGWCDGRGDRVRAAPRQFGADVAVVAYPPSRLTDGVLAGAGSRPGARPGTTSGSGAGESSHGPPSSLSPAARTHLVTVRRPQAETATTTRHVSPGVELGSRAEERRENQWHSGGRGCEDDSAGSALGRPLRHGMSRDERDAPSPRGTDP